MATLTVEYTALGQLSCSGCQSAEVRLCVPPEKVAPVSCDPAAGDQPFEYHTIPALLVKTESFCKYNETHYQYTFAYSDVDVAPGEVIECADIQGVFCEGCLTDYIRDVAGDEVRIEDGPGGRELVTQHGCRYPVTSIDNITASNGLTRTVDDIELGGTLEQNTTIDVDAFDLIVDLTSTGNFEVQNNGAPGVFVEAATTNVGIGTGAPLTPLHVTETTNVAGSESIDLNTFEHIATIPPAGAQFKAINQNFVLTNSDGTQYEAANILTLGFGATGTEVGGISFSVADGAGTPFALGQEALSISKTGVQSVLNVGNQTIGDYGVISIQDINNNVVAIQTSPVSTAFYVLSLPPDAGAAGEVLATDGTGTTNWVNPGTIYTVSDHIELDIGGTIGNVDPVGNYTTTAIGPINIVNPSATLTMEVMYTVSHSAQLTIDDTWDGSLAGETQIDGGGWSTFDFDLRIGPLNVATNTFQSWQYTYTNRLTIAAGGNVDLEFRPRIYSYNASSGGGTTWASHFYQVTYFGSNTN